MASDEKKDDPKDVVSIGPALPNGDVTFVRTRQDETGIIIEGGTGSVLPADHEPDGESEHLYLRHIEDNHFEVTETVRGNGPAKVNSAAFRSNWDTIFGGKQTVGQA